jgi:hypothetical protein
MTMSLLHGILLTSLNNNVISGMHSFSLQDKKKRSVVSDVHHFIGRKQGNCTTVLHDNNNDNKKFVGRKTRTFEEPERAVRLQNYALNT